MPSSNGPNTVEEVKAAVERFRVDYAAVKAQIQRAVVGHEDVIEGVLTCLFTGGNALLEGVPGLGKTLLVRSLAQALSLEFHRIQFTPDLMPADITGTTVVRESAGGGREFVFQKGPVFTQILLADEINRATPKTQSALLESMQERSVTVGGVTHMLPRPFFVMATQNPIEQEGVYPLPEAQLDRFLFKLVVGYSGREELIEILNRTTQGVNATIEKTINAETILQHQALVHRVAIAKHIQDYAVRLVLSTHPKSKAFGGGEYATPQVQRFVRVGASPRAAQALVLGAKCRALMQGRPAASIEDIQKIAMPALRHRVMLNFEGEAEGLTTDQVVENILATVPVQATAAA